MKKLLRKIRVTNSVFLIGTFATTCTAVPYYLWTYGLDLFQIALFFFFAISTAMSITLGYHRLFSHLTFQASPIVRLYTLLFGAAAFEGSALGWCADHRRHHKHVDHEEDPYDINKGLFHAHIGWLLFRRGPESPLTWVRDLQKDKLAWLQHEYYVPIAMFMSFVLPTAIGWVYGGPIAALGAFLIAGVARVVFVHHMTFCINSLCHWIGKRPYSSNVSARDSLLMAIFTFGEGYHNFHHEFQHDYRNGVKPWQFDPTKWIIWTLSKVGLVQDLRRVPDSRIMAAELKEKSLTLGKDIDSLANRLDVRTRELKAKTIAAAHELAKELAVRAEALKEAATNKAEVAQETMVELRALLNQAAGHLETLRRADAGSAA